MITYEELLAVFWQSHRPTRAPWSQQYKSAVFFHDGDQQRAAEQTRDAEAERIGARIFTELTPFVRFHRAEDYHQKYRLRNTRALMEEFATLYESDRDFVDSTAAARVNGLLAGHGNRAALANVDLPADARARILRELDG